MSGSASWYAVVLHWGCTKDTAACLGSLDNLGFDRILLIDNGSGAPELADFAVSHPNVQLVRNEENRGYAAGNNVGLRIAMDQGAEFVAVLNNDVVVEYSKLLGDAESAFRSTASLGVLSPVVYFSRDGWHVQRVNLRFERAVLGQVAKATSYAVPFLPPSTVRAATFSGCCWMVPACVLAGVGLLREDFFLYHEELEYAVRLRRAGLSCAQVGVGSGRVLHKGGTAAGLSPTQAYYSGRNLVLLLEGVSPSIRTRLLLLSCARVGWMVTRCLASRRIRSAVEAACGLVDGLRGKRGPRERPGAEAQARGGRS